MLRVFTVNRVQTPSKLKKFHVFGQHGIAICFLKRDLHHIKSIEATVSITPSSGSTH